MSLDGLRAWIGVVERKLTMRTRVFLVLVAIAIGGAGTGIYLAIDAHDSAVSEAELQAVQDELAGGVTETAAGDVTQLEAELETLKAEVAALRDEQANAGQQGAGGTSQGSSNGPADSQGDANNGMTKQQQQELEKLRESSSGEGLTQK